MRLECSDPAATRRSVLELLRLPERRLDDVLDAWRSDHPDDDWAPGYELLHVLRNGGPLQLMPPKIEIVYFHATRSTAAEPPFVREGLLPRQRSLPRILPELRALAGEDLSPREWAHVRADVNA